MEPRRREGHEGRWNMEYGGWNREDAKDAKEDGRRKKGKGFSN
ncbi:hypothetical protein QT971_11985 [Microcoleus sp. herbarium19]